MYSARFACLLLLGLTLPSLSAIADGNGHGCKPDENGVWLCPPVFFANEIRPGCKLNADASTTTGQCFEQIQHSDDTRLNQVYRELLRELAKRGKQRPEFLQARRQVIAAQQE